MLGKQREIGISLPPGAQSGQGERKRKDDCAVRNSKTAAKQRDASSGWEGGINLTREGTSKLRPEHRIRMHWLATVVLSRAFQAEGGQSALKRLTLRTKQVRGGLSGRQPGVQRGRLGGSGGRSSGQVRDGE